MNVVKTTEINNVLFLMIFVSFWLYKGYVVLKPEELLARILEFPKKTSTHPLKLLKLKIKLMKRHPV